MTTPPPTCESSGEKERDGQRVRSNRRALGILRDIMELKLDFRIQVRSTERVRRYKKFLHSCHEDILHFLGEFRTFQEKG